MAQGTPLRAEGSGGERRGRADFLSESKSFGVGVAFLQRVLKMQTGKRWANNAGKS